MNSMRYLGMTSMKDIERMTMKEYELRMKAFNLKSVDEEYQAHVNAWVNREVNAQRKSGKNKMRYVYRDFKSFFNYDEEIAKVTGEKPDKPKTAAERWMEYERKKKDGGEL